MYVKSYYKKRNPRRGVYGFIALILVGAAILFYFVWSTDGGEISEESISTETESSTKASIDTEEREFEVNLTDVLGGAGNGVATMEYYRNKTTHTVIAELPPLDGDMFYEGWLVRSNPFDFFSTGPMVEWAEDGSWHLDWEGEGDFRDYNEVVITIEPNDDNPAPAEHVLEGSF